MNFCENCNVVTQDKYCPLCGGKKLRPVKSDDFCLITEAATSYSQTLMAAFDEEEIPYSALPYGSGVEAQFGIPLKNYRLFVPYSHYEEAIRIVRDIVNAETEKLRKNLIDGIGGLNMRKYSRDGENYRGGIAVGRSSPERRSLHFLLCRLSHAYNRFGDV